MHPCGVFRLHMWIAMRVNIERLRNGNLLKRVAVGPMNSVPGLAKLRWFARNRAILARSYKVDYGSFPRVYDKLVTRAPGMVSTKVALEAPLCFTCGYAV